jgi:Flp pilus assembly protein TadG
MRRLARPRHGREEGSAAVEAALVLPVLMLFVIGCIEFGRVLWTYHTMVLVVEEGGRYAMVYGASPTLLTSASCPNVATVNLVNCTKARATTYRDNYDGTGIQVSASEDGSSPPNMTISATYTYNFITPFLQSFGPINLSSQVKVPTL